MKNVRVLIGTDNHSRDEFVKWIIDSTCIIKIRLPKEHYDHMLIAAHFIDGRNSPLIEIGYYSFNEDIEFKFVTFSSKTKARLKELYPKQPVNENAVLKNMVKDLKAKNERLILDKDLLQSSCRNFRTMILQKCDTIKTLESALEIEKKQSAKLNLELDTKQELKEKYLSEKDDIVYQLNCDVSKLKQKLEEKDHSIHTFRSALEDIREDYNHEKTENEKTKKIYKQLQDDINALKTPF